MPPSVAMIPEKEQQVSEKFCRGKEILRLQCRRTRQFQGKFTGVVEVEVFNVTTHVVTVQLEANVQMDHCLDNLRWHNYCH